MDAEGVTPAMLTLGSAPLVTSVIGAPLRRPATSASALDLPPAHSEYWEVRRVAAVRGAEAAMALDAANAASETARARYAFMVVSSCVPPLCAAIHERLDRPHPRRGAPFGPSLDQIRPGRRQCGGLGGVFRAVGPVGSPRPPGTSRLSHIRHHRRGLPIAHLGTVRLPAAQHSTLRAAGPRAALLPRHAARAPPSGTRRMVGGASGAPGGHGLRLAWARHPGAGALRLFHPVPAAFTVAPALRHDVRALAGARALWHVDRQLRVEAGSSRPRAHNVESSRRGRRVLLRPRFSRRERGDTPSNCVAG